jgi:hypothetical protein
MRDDERQGSVWGSGAGGGCRGEGTRSGRQGQVQIESRLGGREIRGGCAPHGAHPHGSTCGARRSTPRDPTARPTTTRPWARGALLHPPYANPFFLPQSPPASQPFQPPPAPPHVPSPGSPCSFAPSLLFHRPPSWPTCPQLSLLSPCTPFPSRFSLRQDSRYSLNVCKARAGPLALHPLGASSVPLHLRRPIVRVQNLICWRPVPLLVLLFGHCNPALAPPCHLPHRPIQGCPLPLLLPHPPLPPPACLSPYHCASRPSRLGLS